MPSPMMNGVVLSTNGVLKCNITVSGALYSSAPDLSFTGGGGTGATGYCILSGDSLGQIIITNPGYGYSSAPIPVFTGGGGILAAATSVLNTGFLLSYGYCDFTNDGSFDENNQEQIALDLAGELYCFNDPFNPDSSSITKWNGSSWTDISRTQ